MNTLLAAVAPHLVDLALTLFLGAGAWLAAQGARLFGAGREEKARQALLGLVDLVAAQAREALRQRLSLGPAPAETEAARRLAAAAAEPIILRSADYVARQMPGKLRELGVDREGVERMLRLRLGLHG